VESADAEFIRALALLRWAAENRDEDDVEHYREEANALVMQGLDYAR